MNKFLVPLFRGVFSTLPYVYDGVLSAKYR